MCIVRTEAWRKGNVNVSPQNKMKGKHLPKHSTGKEAKPQQLN